MVAKKFLKRFERLENTPPSVRSKGGVKISRRFERLEVGDRKVEIAITDKVTPEEEKTPAHIAHSLYCPYCGMESETDAENCSFCKHNLKTMLAEDYQDKAGLLRQCECGAMNQTVRLYCWICGKYLGLHKNTMAESGIETDNVINLNIDGEKYKSSDEKLPLDVKILIERIRKNGYSKEIVDEWMKERDKLREIDRGMEKETRRDAVERESRIREIKFSLAVRIVGLILFLIFIMFQLRMCIVRIP